MIWNVLLFVLISISIYFVVELIVEKNVIKKINNYILKKNEEYYDELLKYYEKNKKVKLKEKVNYIHKINILIDKCGIQRSIFINPITMVLAGILCMVMAYYLAFNFFKIVLLSLIICIPFFYVPFAVLKAIANYKEEKIEKVFLNFLLQLKNHTQINNDIISAMKEVKTIEPLQGYVKKFLIEISSGIKFEKAIENFKEKIDIKQIKSFLTNLQNCYLYGGNFSELISKSYAMISEIQREKEKRIQETKGARIVLFILIFLDFFVYISFVKSNQENYLIMKKSVIGMVILYWNFLSIWILVWLSSIVKKLDY